MQQKKKIVILGGGFGGLYTFLQLQKEFSCDAIDVTIVNRTNYFLFTPLLHEVATGGLAHHQVVESIRQLIYKTQAHLHVAELTSIDCDKKTVTTTLGEISYDILVVALGATTNFFNTPGAAEHSFVLKDLHDAIELRSSFIEAFEKASELIDVDARRKELSFAIVGGGATGVELVSETADLFWDTFTRYYHDRIDPTDISLCLINRGPELLAPFHPALRAKALEVIRASGVKILLNTGVTEVRADGLVLSDGSFITVPHIIWTAGVKPNTPLFAQEIPLDPGGRVLVDATLQISSYKEIFVVGDISGAQGPDGKAYPMLAQVATRQGIHTAKNIKRFIRKKPLVPFVYISQGELASLGKWNAVAHIQNLRITGPLAWFIWRTVYLFKFISGSKKIKIMLDWTINIFYPRDITKS